MAKRARPSHGDVFIYSIHSRCSPTVFPRTRIHRPINAIRDVCLRPSRQRSIRPICRHAINSCGLGSCGVVRHRGHLYKQVALAWSLSRGCDDFCCVGYRKSLVARWARCHRAFGHCPMGRRTIYPAQAGMIMLCPANNLTSAWVYQPFAAMMAAIFTQNNEPIFDSESPGATS